MTTERHRVLSALYSGVEVVCLTIILEYLITCQTGIIILGNEHDGVLVASPQKFSEERKLQITKSIECLIGVRLGIRMGSVVKDVSSVQ